MLKMLHHNTSIRRACVLCVVLLMSAVLSGCSVIVKKVGNGFSHSLQEVMKNHNDIETIEAALPTYMLLSDSLIQRHPDSVDAHLTGVTLYSSYAGLIPQKNKIRVKRLSDKAREYAFQALCLEEEKLCDVNNMPFKKFEAVFNQSDLEIELLFTVASTWAGWIKNNQGDWNAVAQLAKAQAMMEEVIERDERYRHGQAHMYMGVIESAVPPSAGGDLEKAKKHFEQAVTFSDGKNLMAKVLYAQSYARMMFDEDLHKRLINEVLEADAKAQDLTLMNMAAKKRARKLAKSAEEYF